MASRNSGRMVFEITYSPGVALRRRFEAVKEVLTDINIDIATTGFSLTAMDTSNIALVRLEIAADAFEKYYCARAASIGVNVPKMCAVLKSGLAGFGPDTAVTMRMREADDSRLEIEIGYDASEEGSVVFNMALMDVESDRLTIPETDPGAKLCLPPDALKCLLSQRLGSADGIKIKALSQQAFVFVGVHEDGLTSRVTYQKPIAEPADEDSKSQVVRIRVRDPVSLEFAGKYLRMFAKGIEAGDTTELAIGDGIPLRLTFRFEGGSLSYYLAPKIIDPEDNVGSDPAACMEYE